MGSPACIYERSFIQLLDDSRNGTGEMIGAVATREGRASKSDLVDIGLDALGKLIFFMLLVLQSESRTWREE